MYEVVKKTFVQYGAAYGFAAASELSPCWPWMKGRLVLLALWLAVDATYPWLLVVVSAVRGGIKKCGGGT